MEYAVNMLCRGENSKSTVELAGINPDEIIKEELLQKIIVCGARTEEMETAKKQNNVWACALYAGRKRRNGVHRRTNI